MAPTRAARASTATLSVTSRWTTAILPPLSARSCSSLASLMSEAVTLAPSAANARAEARPIPWAAAVTTAVLPISLPAIVSLPLVGSGACWDTKLPRYASGCKLRIPSPYA